MTDDDIYSAGVICVFKHFNDCHNKLPETNNSALQLNVLLNSPL